MHREYLYILITYVIITILCLCTLAYSLIRGKRRISLLELLSRILLSFIPMINLVILLFIIEPSITRFLDYLDEIIIIEKKD